MRYHDKSLALWCTTGLMEGRDVKREARPHGLPHFSQLLASCVSLHVFSCSLRVDGNSSVLAAPTHFTVYTEKMNQLTVADVLSLPDLDVLHLPAASQQCPCTLATAAGVFCVLWWVFFFWWPTFTTDTRKKPEGDSPAAKTGLAFLLCDGFLPRTRVSAVVFSMFSAPPTC